MDFRTPELQGLAGVAYKLVSDKGTLLGTITVPYRAADDLCREGRYHFHVFPPLSLRLEAGFESAIQVKVGCLMQSFHWEWHDALQLFGVSIEELEALRGFSFAPSAAYLRSLIE